MGRLTRQLLYGLLGGFLLSALRAPAGLDLLHLPLASARSAALFRAAALLALVLPLHPARRAWREGVRPFPLTLGVGLGFAAHGLLFGTLWEPETRGGFALLLVAGTALLFAVAGGTGDATAAASDARPTLRERAGLVAVGIGLALACEHLARYARLFGVGRPEDDTLLAVAFLTATVLGVIEFGPLLRGPGTRRAMLPAAGALSAAATFFGLRFADFLEYDAGRDPLFNYLRHFGMDLTMVGLLPVTALLGAALFVVPALGLGTTLACARDARRLGALVTGAALGTFSLPYVYGTFVRAYAAPELWSATWSWTPWALATCVAVLGAVLALLGAEPRGARNAGLLSATVALAMVFFLPRLAIWPFSPWYIVAIEPELVVEIPEGLVTVENERGGARIVTLDRKLLTPTARKEEVDERRIEWSWGMLSAEARASDPRVLFVGQMTPSRASLFRSLGTMRLERSVPWDDAAEAIEACLFEGEEAPPGERIPPAEAGARLRSGDYDLVIVAPVQGPLLRPRSANVLPWGAPGAPATAGLGVPEGTVAVAWIDGGAPLVSRRLTEHALVAAKSFDDLSLGLLFGVEPAPRTETRVPMFSTGEPRARDSGLTILRRRADRRAREQRKAISARIAAASVGTDAEKIARGLAQHYAAQKTSSVFDSYAAQIELEEDELRSFFEAAVEVLDPLSRAIWEDLAVLLAEKRRVDMLLVYLEPLVERYGPLPAFERGIAYAYKEFDMPDEALAALDSLLERDPYQIDLLLECADLAREKGDGELRLDYLERALAIQPDNLEARIRQGEALLEAGDPEGQKILADLLAAHPENERLQGDLAADEGP